MGLAKKILNIALAVVNVLTFYIRRQPNRITFISLTSDTLTSDFKLMDDMLKESGKYDIHYNLIRFEQNMMGDLKYFFNCLKQLVEMKKSALIILNDNNYIVSTRKPKGCKVLQIWHACGAVKKFGNEIKRQYPINNYDYVLSNADYWKPVYAKSFNVDPNQVITTGMPRLDTLLKNQETDSFYQKYPECKGKKLLLYAPTFRGNIIDGFKMITPDITKINLDPDTLILYKFHPLLGDMKLEGKQCINMNAEDLYTLMNVCDVLISDYSSVFFDWSLLNKPYISYIPDMDNYKETIGLNIDYENDFPGPVCHNEKELSDALYADGSVYLDKRKKFKEKYMKYDDGQNTKRVVQFIEHILGKML